MSDDPTVMAKLAARLTSHWRLKTVGGLGLISYFCLFYFGLQAVVLFPIRSVPATAWELGLPFDPTWVWVYQSVYLVMPMIPCLVDTAADLRRYVRGFLCVSGVGFLVFLLFPVEAPPQFLGETHMAYRLLIAYTGRLNSFPSLHVGLLVYTLLFGYRVFGTMPACGRWLFLAVGITYTAALGYSTVATKMHWLVDLPAGVLVACLGHSAVATAGWRPPLWRSS